VTPRAREAGDRQGPVRSEIESHRKEGELPLLFELFFFPWTQPRGWAQGFSIVEEGKVALDDDTRFVSFKSSTGTLPADE
jgi:hypothetical protein